MRGWICYMFKPMMVSVYWSFCCEFALKEEIITKKTLMCNGVCKWLVHHMPSIFVRNKIPCNLNFILGICSIYYFIQQLDNFVYLNTFAECIDISSFKNFDFTKFMRLKLFYSHKTCCGILLNQYTFIVQWNNTH